MKKKIICIIVGALLICALMFIEYRCIMRNIVPTYGENGIVYLEVFGQVDAYQAK